MSAISDHARSILDDIQDAGLNKAERIITTPQSGRIAVAGPDGACPAINLCANNYLGLADHPAVIAAAHAALDSHGFGMASVRFICGTQDLHKALERRLADWLGTDDAILFGSCFDANGAVFEPLLGEGDAIVSDSLNHASIIDGIRLCKAARHRYPNGDMGALAAALERARADGAARILIVTDGVFSMDGTLADLPAITALAARFGASVMVDDCHATGFIGPQGRGTPARAGVAGSVEIVTGTLGKALGGAMGGFVAASQPIVDLLRQRARPYLFSNSLAPALAAGALAAIDLAEAGDNLRARLFRHTARFRAALTGLGYSLLPGETPIIPVMLGDARRANDLAQALDRRGVYVTAFSYPVVPMGQARIRTQMSAALDDGDLDAAIDAFDEAGRETGILQAATAAT
jgi:glycine C-acetyltransferase